ncbi:MAG: DUF3052 family protein [Chthoniobacterales bacterium]|nr:DUF3052 family protein [Chthoniobacterales bacterium]
MVHAEVEALSLGRLHIAGYSDTPLARKLGSRPDERIVAPRRAASLSRASRRLARTRDDHHARVPARPVFVHLFVRRRAELEKRLVILRARLADTGILWVSWPKRASGVATDVTEDVIRAVALLLGLVDVKVCAIDGTWSGLKLTVRRENRKQLT